MVLFFTYTVEPLYTEYVSVSPDTLLDRFFVGVVVSSVVSSVILPSGKSSWVIAKAWKEVLLNAANNKN